MRVRGKLAQNAVHSRRCPFIGDGKEEIWEDQEYCRAVADFLV